mgnify:CR=1 FL=1
MKGARTTVDTKCQQQFCYQCDVHTKCQQQFCYQYDVPIPFFRSNTLLHLSTWINESNKWTHVPGNKTELQQHRRNIYEEAVYIFWNAPHVHSYLVPFTTSLWDASKQEKKIYIYSLPPGGRPLVIRYGLCDIRYYTYDIIHTILYTAILFEQENKCQLAHARADVTRMHDSFTRYDTIRI